MICFTCIFLIIYRMPDKYGWRCSFLLASIVWGVLLTVITELLSLFHILVYEWVIGLWALAGLITLIILLSKRREVYGRFEITGISPFPIALMALQNSSLDLVAIVDDVGTGRKFLGYRVLPVDVLRQIAFDRLIITAEDSVVNAAEHLGQYGVEEDRICYLR